MFLYKIKDEMSVWTDNDESEVSWVDEKEMTYWLMRGNRGSNYGVDADVCSDR